MKGMWTKFKSRMGVTLLLAAFLVSLIRVLTLQYQADVGGGTVIRLVHWQMEADVQDALNAVARAYEKLHPDIRIEQIVIGERGYLSWLTTRLIGGTAPDIVAVPDEQLYQKYFLPLTAEVLKPNPYNAGSPLEGVPWKETYFDGMNGGFIPLFLEYYSVPTSAFSVRLFFNKALLREATGLDIPPKDFRAFITACEQISSYGKQIGHTLVPIAGAGKFNAKPLWDRFDISVNSSLLKTVDVNYDGLLGDKESLIAFTDGTVSFTDPRIAASFKGREEYNRQFQPGFFGADRMDAAFLFLQQRAAMIASGSWDAGSYANQADFEIGICNFPLPSQDDPEFGRFVEGPAAEELRGAFSFSINRASPHVETSLDFLRFLSSQKINEQLNRRIKWIPMIRGNRPDPFIAPFWPQVDGVRPGISLEGSTRNKTVLEGLLNLHATGRLSFEDLIEKYTRTYPANADLEMRVDFPRKTQLALVQSEFNKVSERAAKRPNRLHPDKEFAILESQMALRHELLESRERYEKARAKSTQP